MCSFLEVSSVEALIAETVPSSIRLSSPMDLPEGRSEESVLAELRAWAAQNACYRSYIGMGYYPTYTPAVIQRNVLENPAWYTAYTPYQSEISQGRLEALLNFQTMVCDLSGMDLANASLLDEATAAAEAVGMLWRLRSSNSASNRVCMVGNIFPQTEAVVRSRAKALGIEVRRCTYEAPFGEEESAPLALLVQYPDAEGGLRDYTKLFEQAHARHTKVIVCADLWALSLLKPPGEMGADVVVGSTQRFGIPMGYGGPHAAYFATRSEYKRHLPGRVIGVSRTAQGETAYRMALQTREQHIRRERATSNVCTAQVLLAVMASFYAVYHGKEGLQALAERTHRLTQKLAAGMAMLDLKPTQAAFFDTLSFHLPDASTRQRLLDHCEAKQINLRTYFEDVAHTHAIGISLDETTTIAEVEALVLVFAEALSKDHASALAAVRATARTESQAHAYPRTLARTSEYLTHPTFRRYHSEHELLRYIRRLEEKDLSLVHGMIPLGSCTMKLNATTEMQALGEAGFAELHPFVPRSQAKGYQTLMHRLEQHLCAITGFASVCFQPNSGAQGEYAGLSIIQSYHRAQGETQRDIILIPASAHGTNPASAKMAGCQVLSVACDKKGNVAIDDLRAKLAQVGDRLSALMITYPSTHGVFESSISDITHLIHAQGGQVYMDGANMNAQIGLTSPARIGADVCHLNLHKTFCIPHGGGGPGMGPIGVAAHLKAFLPTHPVIPTGEKDAFVVAAAPYSSASLLTISYAYIALMGGTGLRIASEKAILSANYLKKKLSDHYHVLYTGDKGRVAHEMILDCRPFQAYGITVEDIAKRLMDYGFHAPTISFPVPGTMMIEPTESEHLSELDRFSEALIAIRAEIDAVAEGTFDSHDNVLKNAPHTASALLASDWTHAYSRELAAYPLPYVRRHKFWPPVGRVDNALGDRNLMCSCPPMAAYSQSDTETEPTPHA